MLHETQLNKSGKNKFANFNYFELGDFIPQVTSIFEKVGLCGIVSFTPDTAYLTVHDTDGDGLTDANDLDSDNDGIPDIEETGFKALSNGLSTFDKTNGASWADANGNGFNDIIEAQITAGTYTLLDTDGDGVANYIDLDSDNDSFFDTDEAGLLFGDGDINGDGKGDYTDLDTDGSGCSFVIYYTNIFAAHYKS
jgi:hypothetical protein